MLPLHRGRGFNLPETIRKIGTHNPHLETLIKMCADEALFVGDPRHRNTLFSLITEPTIMIDPKFITAYSAPNFPFLKVEWKLLTICPAR